MLVLKEIGIALDVIDEELIWHELNESGEVNFEMFGRIESISNKEIISAFMSLAKGLEHKEPAVCIVCGKEFLTKQPSRAKFCSNACTQKNKYKKKIETKI